MATSANRIHRARSHAKLTQNELAARVGVSRSAVAQWEQVVGTKPSTTNLCQIAIVTSVRFEWLGTGRGAMKLDDAHQASAVVMSDFAHDALESRLLLAIRRVGSARKRQVIVDLVEGLAR